MKAFVLASNNAHKIQEVERVLHPLGYRLSPLKEFPEIPEPPETGTTFEANALQKARFVFERTQKPTLADDSGLEVDALDGRPGVYSKRYTPEATARSNNKKLLEEMAHASNRSARFVCALALVTSTGERVWRGTVEGVVGALERGDHGFGYDPVFLPNARPGKTMAELTAQEKDAISHRGAALEQLAEQIKSLVG